MLYHKILLLMTLQKVLSYHFYNPSLRQIITRDSINGIPSGYKLLPPPMSYRNRFQRGKKGGSCIDAGFTCKSPFEKYLTFQYECNNDDNCPRNFKCCKQRCFVHKICSKAFPDTRPNENNTGSKPLGKCEKWPYTCQIPYDFSLTSRYKCDYDRQCPRNFKCCQQSCFVHRICSRIVASDDTTFTTNGNVITEATTQTTRENVNEMVTETEATTEVSVETDNEIETEENVQEIEYIEEPEEIENTEEVENIEEIGNTTKVVTETDNDIEIEEKENTTKAGLITEYDEYDDEDEDEDDVNYEEQEEESDEYKKTTDILTMSKNDKEIISADGLTPHIGIQTNTQEAEYKSFKDRQNTKPIYRARTTTPSTKTHDPNAIIPEYAAYYYYYEE